MANFNIYEMVTNRIIEQLQTGIIPWRKPWKSSVTVSGKVDLSRVAWNRFTKTVYSALNQMLLSRVGEYGTFKQWTEIGGKIRKGSKAEIVTFWKILPIDEVDETTGKVTKKNIPFLRYYQVFHISDVENVKPLDVETVKPVSEPERIKEAEEIICAYSARENLSIRYGGNRAFYSPCGDYVQLPERGQFFKTEEYYSTAFHELTHSTLAENRCNRKDSIGTFGSHAYSKEELVAEIGAAGMLSLLGIETSGSFTNSVAYIQAWLKALKNDPKMIVSASSKAEKAIDFILHGKQEACEKSA